MKGVPPALVVRRRRIDRELGLALALLLFSGLVAGRLTPIAAVPLILVSILWVGSASYKLGRFTRDLPVMIERYEEEQEARRIERLERDERQQKAYEEARVAMEETRRIRQHEKTSSFLAVLESERGRKFELQTSIAPIWVTHCRDGRIRVWWPDYSPVLRSGVDAVKGRATWDADEPKGWYVHRGRERDVLTELSKI